MALSSAAKAIQKAAKPVATIKTSTDNYGNIKVISVSSSTQPRTASVVSPVYSPPPKNSQPETEAVKTKNIPKAVETATSEKKGFTNPFFSFEGQKERIENAGNWISYGFGSLFVPGKLALPGYGVNPEHKKNLIETAASYPYVTAAAGAAAYTAAAPAVSSLGATKAASVGIGAAATKAASVGSKILPFGIGAAAGGLLAGFFGTKGGAENAPQTQNPQMSVDPNIQPAQQPQQKTLQNPQQGLDIQPSQGSGVNLSNSPYAQVFNTLNQDTYSFSNPITNSESNQFNIQNTTTHISPTQTATQEQQATATGGINWGLIAAVAAGVLILKR